MIQTDKVKQHEKLLFDAFMIKDQKQRVKLLLNKKKGREKLREKLAHSIKFNPQIIQKIPEREQTIDNILEILVKANAPEKCYLISENISFDGKEMNLKDALLETIGSGVATIISCIPGKLAYFEGEGINNRFILKSH